MQINDEAVNTTETWSSKKLLDTLCPPFIETGNPITCHPVEDYPLDVTVTMEPIQAGEGDPSPDNVRPITGYDSLSLTRCGKNLLNPLYTTKNQNNLYWGKNTDGIRLEKGKTYTLSNSENLICSGINVTNKDGSGNVFVGYTKASLTFTPTSTITAWFQIYKSEGIEDGVELMLELGSTPTDFEPYQGNTYNIALPETVYGGTVDCVTGEGEKTWGYLEFNGSESWGLYEPSSVRLSNQFRIILSGFYADGCVSSHYKSNTTIPQADKSIQSTSYFGNSVNICDSGFNSVEEWKSYLAAQHSAGTPVTVCYKLAAPEPFQATGNQALPAVAGLNTVYTDGDSLDVSGRQDLLYTLQNMQTQTTNLNRFIAEGGTQ